MRFKVYYYIWKYNSVSKGRVGIMETLNKYDDSISLSYNYAYRILLRLKNIINNLKNIESTDDITMEVYRDSIINRVGIV